MKVYVSLNSLTIIKIKQEKPFYQGSNFVDKIRLLFDATDEAISPTLTFRLPTGRRVGPIYPIGLDAGETRLITEEGKSWYYFDFILSAVTGLLEHPGQLEASIILNYFSDNGTVTKQAVAGTIVNNIVKTTVYGDGNIIVVGDNPDDILADFSSNLASLSNRQTSIEKLYKSVAKLIPTIIDNAENGQNRLEFSDGKLALFLRDRLFATFDIDKENLNVESNIEATDVKIGDNKDSVKNNIDLIKSLAKVIVNALKDGTAQVTFSDSTIEITHQSKKLATLSREGGITFFSDVSIDGALTANDHNILDELTDLNNSTKSLASVINNILKDGTAQIIFSDNDVEIIHQGKRLALFSKQNGTTIDNENGVNLNGPTNIIGRVDINGNLHADKAGTSVHFNDGYVKGNWSVLGRLLVGGRDVMNDLLDRYTKEEVNTLISRIPKMSKKVVNALPTTDIDEDIIYLVPSTTQDEDNAYNEYIYINGKPEPLGTTKVDLSNFVQSALSSETDSRTCNSKLRNTGTGVDATSHTSYNDYPNRGSSESRLSIGNGVYLTHTDVMTTRSHSLSFFGDNIWLANLKGYDFDEDPTGYRSGFSEFYLKDDSFEIRSGNGLNSSSSDTSIMTTILSSGNSIEISAYDKIVGKTVLHVDPLTVSVTSYNSDGAKKNPTLQLGDNIALTTADVTATDAELDEIIEGAWV